VNRNILTPRKPAEEHYSNCLILMAAGPATAGVNVVMGVAGTLHITDVLTNTTGSPITVTYAVTPTSGAGCVGAAVNVVITVNPAP